jgi:hypothetical protein
MCVTEDLLRDLQVAGQVENALCERVPEEMGMDEHTCVAADVTQRRLERCIAQWLAAPLPQSDPERFGAFYSAAFLLEIKLVHRPEIIGDGDTMFASCTLEANDDQAALAVDIRQRHPQNAVPSGTLVPIALSRKDEAASINF